MSWVKNNEWLVPDPDHQVRWSELRRFLANYQPFSRRLVAAAVLALIGSAAAFLIPVIFRVAQHAVARRDALSLVLALLSFLGVVLLDVATTYGIRIIKTRVSTLLSRELVLQYYRKILNLAVEDFIAFRQRTNLFQRVIDAMAITNQSTDVLVHGGQSLVVIVMIGAVVALLSPIVLGVLVTGLLVLFAYALAQGRELRILRQRTLAVNYPLVGKMTEIINGLFTIKALAASVRVTSDVVGLVDGKTDAEHREQRAEVRSNQVIQAIRAVTLVAAVGTSFALLLDRRLVLADILSLYVLSNLLLQPVAELAAQYQSLSRLSVNVRNYYEVLNLQDEAAEVEAATARRKEFTASVVGSTPPRHKAEHATVGTAGSTLPLVAPSMTSDALLMTPDPLEPSRRFGDDVPSYGAEVSVRGHITFHEVEFAYRGGEPILTGVDLEIDPGEKVSLIGRSGVGKTTLLRLLLGFLQPQRGTILVDGVDITALQDRNAYRRQFGVVGQQDVFFGVSIRENLLFGLEEAVSDERIEEALRMVKLWDQIERLSDGIDAAYSDDLFSGGQKQRLFIARALLRQPSIVLLDEPTSALDFQSEGQVMDALDRLAGSKTTLTIAHRLSTVQSSDRVLLLADGHIKAAGSHEDLYRSSSYYRALCEYNSFVL